MRKNWLLVLCIAIAATLSIGGTMAYLQDSDSDVNVMTLGSVYIEQLEKTREGDFTSTEGAAEYVSLYPGVYEGDEPVEDDGYYTAQNAQDKIVSVKNTGKSPAYVRTWFAFEQGSMNAEDFNELMLINWNDEVEPSKPVHNVALDEKLYTIYLVTYPDALMPDEETVPSLMQVLLSKDADNDDMLALDPENDGYRIKVISQGVQQAGFEDVSADIALNEAFGKTFPNTSAAPEAGEPEGTVVTSAEALQEAFDLGGKIKLGNDIESTSQFTVSADSILDLNGFTLKGNIPSDNPYDELITVNAAFTLMDSSEQQTGTISNEGLAVHVYNTFTLESGLIQSSSYTSVIVASGARFEMNGGVIEVNDTEGQGGTGVNNQMNATTVLHSGKILIKSTGIGTAVCNWASLTVKSCMTIEVEALRAFGVLNDSPAAQLFIEGGIITVTCTEPDNYNRDAYGVMNTYGTAIISGGTIKASGAGSYTFGVSNGSGTITVEGNASIEPPYNP